MSEPDAQESGSLFRFQVGNDLAPEVMIDLLRRSTLAERRPVSDLTIVRAMIEHADVLVTAWSGEHLVGMARTLTDFLYVAYLADLAVDAAYQRRGLGRALIEKTRDTLAPSCFITLLAAPAANEYYANLGFIHNPRAWMLPARTPPPLG